MADRDAPLDLECSAAPGADDLDVVDAGIDGHNRAQPALAEVEPLAVFARDGSGQVQGGAVGRTWGQCCELQQLWVAHARRRAGTGSALMERFEQEAGRRGCSLVYLETFSFQAPAFYARRGYRVVLEVSGYTGGIVRFTMHKRLAA